MPKTKEATDKIEKKELVERIRPPTYSKIYGTNAFVGCSNFDFRIDICNEKLQNKDGKSWSFVIENTIILNPRGAKLMFLALQKCIEHFEKNNGKIDETGEGKTIQYF